MDAKRLRNFRELLYGEPKPKPRWQRTPFHLGLWFDVVIIVATVMLAIVFFAT